jgi:membrane protein YqaA with SNARE-associated domain
MNQYLQTAFESAWVASIVPFGAEPTFFAMQSFGGFNMPLAVAAAITGATLAQCVNFAIGKLLLKLKSHREYTVSDEWYAKLCEFFQTYGIFMLLFSWMPLCKMFVVAAGFFGTRFRLALPLVIIGLVYNYGRYLF